MIVSHMHCVCSVFGNVSVETNLCTTRPVSVIVTSRSVCAARGSSSTCLIRDRDNDGADTIAY